jgi:hypothetical protein
MVSQCLKKLRRSPKQPMLHEYVILLAFDVMKLKLVVILGNFVQFATLALTKKILVNVGATSL